MSRLLLIISLLFLVSCEALVCGFDRTLEGGSVTGRVVTDDGEPARFASLTFLNASTVAHAGEDGTFTVKALPPGAWAVRADHDIDGDGLVDASALGVAQIDVTEHASGYLGSGAAELTGVDLGDLVVETSATVRADVRVKVGDNPAVIPSGLGFAVALVVDHESCVPAEGASQNPIACTDADEARRIPASVLSFVDDDGRVEVRAPRGNARVALVVAALLNDGFDVVAKAVHTETVTLGGETEDLGTVEIVIPPSTPPLQDIFFDFSPATDAPAYVVLSPVGQRPPTCSDVSPATVDAPFVLADITNQSAGTMQIATPPGVYDVHACFGTDDVAVSFQTLVIEGDAADIHAYATLQRDAPLDCARGDIRDCDGDGLKGLPPLVVGDEDFDDNRADWLACADVCTGGNLVAPDTFGARAVGSCTLGDRTFDCDDDADGQPDATEPSLCVGAFLGTDLDGDGLCGSFDPAPRCRANVACVGVDDFPPPVDSVVLGGETFCSDGEPQTPDPDERCVLQGTGVSRCAALFVRCYRQGCFVDDDCEQDARCLALNGATQCRPACVLADDQCDTDTHCADGGSGGHYCAPDDGGVGARSSICFCDDESQVLVPSPAFIQDVGDDAGCGDDDGLWTQCALLWSDAGTL